MTSSPNVAEVISEPAGTAEATSNCNKAWLRVRFCVVPEMK